jgi:hypothetical protein
MPKSQDTAPAAAQSAPLTLCADASEVPALIAGNVNLMRFAEALARAGMAGRYDAARGVLVLEAMEPDHNPAEALVGMAVYNGWSRAERAHWHQVAHSAVPADAFNAYCERGA